MISLIREDQYPCLVGIFNLKRSTFPDESVVR